MTNSLRSFIALDLCNEQKAILKNIQTRLKAADADVKWVEPDNFHITLKFLGIIPQHEITPIAEIMDSQAKETASFSIEFGGLGAFPSVERPDIIWAGLTQGQQQLTALADILEEALFLRGFPKETKKFHPHITIGRKRTNHNINALSAALKTTPLISTVQKALHITLFQSDLSSDGPRYSVLHQSHLKT